MRNFLQVISVVFCLFFFQKITAQTDAKKAVKDSMNPQIEAQILARLGAINAELEKIEAFLADSTQKGYFSSILSDSISSTYYRIDESWSMVSERTVWPIDTNLAVEADVAEMPMDSSFVPTTMPDAGNPFKMFRKKSPRTVFNWGFSWGVADVVGDFTAGGDAVNPNFDFGQSRHRRFALMLRTRLGKRDTTDNFTFGGGGKFNIRKIREAKDQFRRSKFNLKYGIVFDRVSLEQISDFELDVVAGKPIFMADSEIEQSKNNKLVVNYLEFPLLAEFMITKSVKIEAGPFVGFRTRSRQTIEYVRNPFEIVRNRRDALGLRKYNYGLMAGAGLKEIYLSAKLDLSNFLIENENYDFRLLSLGVTLGL
jgi:Outer membrane protein beta-barrel domain